MRVLRRCSFFIKAPPLCNELKPAAVMFSHSRLPSHDLCGLLWTERPDDIKPGIINTGVSAFASVLLALFTILLSVEGRAVLYTGCIVL
mmetsp:Transcript_9482/g.17163  ORF Transcript_9482/g.17163 Transcript_9482/m.17163 type:complete len:89 (+) Transcript_9482:501-767(+)